MPSIINSGYYCNQLYMRCLIKAKEFIYSIITRALERDVPDTRPIILEGEALSDPSWVLEAAYLASCLGGNLVAIGVRQHNGESVEAPFA